MSTLLLLQLLALAALLLASAFFSSAEVAFFSLHPIQIHRLEKDHPPAGRRLRAVLAEPNRLLSSILIGNTVVNVSAAVLGYAITEKLLPGQGEKVAIPVMTTLLLIFAEITPKRIAMAWPRQLARIYTRPMKAVLQILAPVQAMLESTGSLAAGPSVTASRISGDDLAAAIELPGDQTLDPHERRMLSSVVRLGRIQASDVMTPRVDLHGIDLNQQPSTEIITAAHNLHLRYVILFREDLDHIIGFLDIRAYRLDPHHRMETAQLPPYYVPETARLDGLLYSFLAEGRRIAVVVDEYGGTAGVITRGDILEEVVGEMDEHAAAPIFEPLGRNRWIVEGSVSLEDVNQRLGVNLDAEGADRLAGWFSAHAGHIPRAGETLEVQGVRAAVLRMRRHRIATILLEKVGTQAPEGTTP